MISVKNKKTYKGPGEYVGRPSVLGNPFTMPPHSREEAIFMYESWLRQSTNVRVCQEIDRLTDFARKGDLVLVCWCNPLGCHGDIIKKIIEERLAL